jgi:hypothetical protein
MAQFVTAQQVIDNSFSSTNTDPNFIKTTSIEQTQLKHIKPVLTEDLYDLIVTENNASSLSAVNQTIFDTYIVPAMYWFVKHDVILDIAIKSNSKGVNRSFGNFSEQGTNTDVSHTMEVAFANGVKILERMTEYIQDNETDYPTYNRGENVLNDVSYRGGIIY